MSDEFGFIDGLMRRGLSKLGDDCAVLPKNETHDTVVSADLLVEDIDFRRDWMPPEILGARALSVSLSDVAAMGATPVWSMTSIGVPEDVWKSGFVDRFYDGYLEQSRRFGVELVGGDVSRTPDKIVIDSVVGGDVEKGRAILRSGANAGDAIFVSGPLGGAAAGLKLLLEGMTLETAIGPQGSLIMRQLQPTPEVEKGRLLATSGAVSAMIDLSDGLSSDLAHLARASGVGATIFADRIPFDAGLEGIAATPEERLRFALDGGEDFRLLFTAPREVFFERSANVPEGTFFEIGAVSANSGILRLIDGNVTSELTAKGWRHF